MIAPEDETTRWAFGDVVANVTAPFWPLVARWSVKPAEFVVVDAPSGRCTLVDRDGGDGEGVAPRAGVAVDIAVGARHGVAACREDTSCGRDRAGGGDDEMGVRRRGHERHRSVLAARHQMVGEAGRVRRRNATRRRCTLIDRDGSDDERVGPRAGVTVDVAVGARHGVAGCRRTPPRS